MRPIRHPFWCIPSVRFQQPRSDNWQRVLVESTLPTMAIATATMAISPHQELWRLAESASAVFTLGNAGRWKFAVKSTIGRLKLAFNIQWGNKIRSAQLTNFSTFRHLFFENFYFRIREQGKSGFNSYLEALNQNIWWFFNEISIIEESENVITMKLH